MCLVYDKPNNMTRQKYLLYGPRTEHLGSNIEQGGIAILHALYGQRTAYGVEQSVDGNSICNASFSKVIHLIFHQRLQRRNDHRESVYRTTFHQGWQLECN